MSWLVQIKGFAIDITGVLCECVQSGKAAIPGSVDAIKMLLDAHIPMRLVTNETELTRSGLCEQLRRFGFPISEEQIISPPVAMARILKANNLRPHLLVHPGVLDDFKELDLQRPNALVIGDAAESFTYPALNSAFRFLVDNPSASFYSMGQGKYYQKDGELVLDVGPFKAALEYALQREATVVGKPSAQFFKSALQDLNLPANEVVMIGDDIITDVMGAKTCGMYGIQVRTGKYRKTDEPHPTAQPDLYVDNLKQAVDLFFQHRCSPV